MEELVLTKEQLLMKSEGVKDCVKWLEKKLKGEKNELENDNKNYDTWGMFDDCGPSYENAIVEREARMEALVEVKVSLEKYMRKLRHMADEVYLDRKE